MCKDCEARRKMARDALINAKLGEAAKQIVKGAGEIFGLKPKTGEAELKAKPIRKTGRK